MNKKLWTGKTPREALKSNVCVIAGVQGVSVYNALEAALYDAEKAPDGSEKREGLRYWDSLSADGQVRFVRECRRVLRNEDRLLGRGIER